MLRPERLAWHRIARERGWTVREAQHKLDSLDFTELLAVEYLEPGEPFRTDARFAMLACEVHNVVARIMGDKNSMKSPDKFMISFERSDTSSRQMPQAHIEAAINNFVIINRAVMQGAQQRKKS